MKEVAEMPMKTIQMAADGRLTMPAAARRALGIEGAAHLVVDVREGAEIVLRPAEVHLRDDSWMREPEVKSLLERARRSGTVEVTADEIKALIVRE
jgi:bifunctional DNA-binding transcriptional regulator/antitoxin component of YhaV-PrlF toxin-antitoxin module